MILKVPITRLGYYRLLKELVYLRRVVRPEVLEELQNARSYGVKTDNQQYLLAKEKHAVLQRKIRELEEKLARCEVVVGRKFFLKQVGFGADVVIQNIENGKRYEYQLVGPYESDVGVGKLSIDSPVGRCLLGHREGEEVTVYTPSGIRIYRIIAIRS